MPNDTKTNCRTRRLLLTILLVALGLRILAACGLQSLLDHRWHRDFLIAGDAEGYWMLAQRISAGEDYSIYTPPRYALRMPGFPALLAIPVTFFGPKLFAARLFLAFVGTLGCWLVFRLGRDLFNVRVGLMAAVLAAISPVLVVFSETILSETAFAVTMLWSLLAGHHLYCCLNPERLNLTSETASHPSDIDSLLSGSPLSDSSPPANVATHVSTTGGHDWRSRFHPGGRAGFQALHTGLAIAAGVMMRPSWILAAPIVAALLTLLSKPRPRAALAGGIVILAMVLALLPWGLRNQRVTGHFTFTTFWMGPSLYDGLNPVATGDSNMEFYDRDRLMLTMDEYEVDQHYRQAARQFVIDHPQRTAQLALTKAARYWSPWPNADQFSQWWAKLIVGLFFVPVLLLSVWGAICLFMRAQTQVGSHRDESIRRANWSLAILAGPIFYFALIHMVFVSSLRYRLPAEYSLLVLAAFGLTNLWTNRRASQA